MANQFKNSQATTKQKQKEQKQQVRASAPTWPGTEGWSCKYSGKHGDKTMKGKLLLPLPIKNLFFYGVYIKVATEATFDTSENNGKKTTTIAKWHNIVRNGR